MMRPALTALVTLGALLLAESASAQRAGGCVGRDRTVRRSVAATAFVGGNVALYQYFESAWWSGEPAKFHYRHDWDENHRDQDKFGHLVGGFQLTHIGASLLREACLSPRSAILWSAAYATLFQLQIEIWDGMQQKYGFSPPDLLFNAAGAGFAVARQMSPRVAAFKPTMSYWPTRANRVRNNYTGEPRFTVDYSGQTYWLSADIDALLPEKARASWPGIVRASLGHGITDYFPPPNFVSKRARHTVLLTLDLDAAKLPGEQRGWRTVKRALSYVHLPSPALQIAPDLRFIALYK